MKPHFACLLLVLVACSSTESSAETATVALFNGKNLSGWHADVPAADTNPDVSPSFVAHEASSADVGTGEDP